MKIKVTVNGRVIDAESGERLSEVLLRAGFSLSHPCGGRGVCGKCTVTVNGSEELSCRYILSSDVTVNIKEEGDFLFAGAETPMSPEGRKSTFPPDSECSLEPRIGDKAALPPDSECNLGLHIENETALVLDLGTTTLSLALLDLREKRVLRVVNAKNPQRAFGADVISRIEYATEHGVGELSRLIYDGLSKMISELGASSVDTLYVAGNTVMLHIFAGENPASMGVAPYTPKFLCEKTLDAEALGVRGVKKIKLLPSVSSFVGADAVAGVSYVGFHGSKYRMLVDLGTNAEIMLFSRDKIIATSAAAGPCFEGACISCGMSATDGAVYAYDGKNIKTVGETAPTGISGTGLVDIVAHLLKNGTVDESGYMESERFYISDGVFVSRSDIRQYQLAKSAIYSAIVALLKENNVGYEDIDMLYISGGFSAKINIENAVLTELIPYELKDKSVPLGNTSLLGTVKAVLEGSDLSSITEKAVYTDLSSDSIFSELFIKNMSFGRFNDVK